MLTGEEKLEEMALRDEHKLIAALEKKMLTDLTKYLSSSIFYDIGPVISKRIVAYFGIRTALALENTLHEVLQVRGVGIKRMISIERGWSFQRRTVEKSAELIVLRSPEAVPTDKDHDMSISG